MDAAAVSEELARAVLELKRGHAGDVVPRWTMRLAAAENHLLDLRRIERRSLPEHMTDGVRRQVVRARDIERAPVRLGKRRARLQALFHIVEVLDDTNLAHRGGLPGLHFAQQAARDFLRAGGAARPDAIDHARAIHARFVSRRLSPGGAADVLAAACLLDRICPLP